MVGLFFSIFIFLISVTTACFINCYALSAIFPQGKLIDKTTRIGMSAVISLILVISGLVFQVYAWEEFDFLLTGGITGVSYTSLRLLTKQKLSFTGSQHREKIFRLFGLYLGNIGTGIAVAYAIIRIIGLLTPKSIF
jgi:hypothetical protein